LKIINENYVVIYFFYHIVKKDSFQKKMLLNFRKSMGLLMGLVNFFLFHPLGLNEIKFHNLFHFDFYKIIIILKKILGLV
jgi:hypothetical protein